MCVCVFCHPIFSGGHTRFLHLPSAMLALIFLARRAQPFFSIADHEVEFGILCPNDLIVLHFLGIFCFVSFLFL